MVGADLQPRLRALRSEPGLDIWLSGDGDLFSKVLAWDLVDTVEPAVVPVLLGGGVPFVACPSVRRRLTLLGHHADPNGRVLLEYEVQKERGVARAEVGATL